MSSIDINKLSCGGNGYIEQVMESVNNLFWKDVLYAWKSVILQLLKKSLLIHVDFKAKIKECILIILSPPS
jgi:hypothetical protein